jgi:MFS family permease
MAGAFLYGIATGLFSPASAAWTSDLSDPDHRGRAMATMYISLEAGIGIGALAAGWLFQDQVQRVPFILYGTAALTVPGLVYLLRTQNYREQNSFLAQTTPES